MASRKTERVFVVSILGGGKFEFPTPIPLEKRLKDVLESNVAEKYYLNDKTIKSMIELIQILEDDNTSENR